MRLLVAATVLLALAAVGSGLPAKLAHIDDSSASDSALDKSSESSSTSDESASHSLKGDLDDTSEESHEREKRYLVLVSYDEDQKGSHENADEDEDKTLVKRTPEDIPDPDTCSSCTAQDVQKDWYYEKGTPQYETNRSKRSEDTEAKLKQANGDSSEESSEGHKDSGSRKEGDGGEEKPKNGGNRDQGKETSEESSEEAKTKKQRSRRYDHAHHSNESSSREDNDLGADDVRKRREAEEKTDSESEKQKLHVHSANHVDGEDSSEESSEGAAAKKERKNHSHHSGECHSHEHKQSGSHEEKEDDKRTRRDATHMAPSAIFMDDEDSLEKRLEEAKTSNNHAGEDETESRKRQVQKLMLNSDEEQESYSEATPKPFDEYAQGCEGSSNEDNETIYN